jgi:two-component system sensor histidine kinase ChvG
LITSRRSTASDTDIKKDDASFYRNPYEISRLLDLYWGGSERRITKLTLRILGVNVFALLILVLSFIYLGKYHNNVIEARLQTFQREIELIAVALSEGDFREMANADARERVKSMLSRLALGPDKQLYLFDQDGELYVKTVNFVSSEERERVRYQSVRVLKELLQFVLGWMPDRRELPLYHGGDTGYAKDYPGVLDSLEGQVSLSAWTGERSKIFLSSSVPLVKDGVSWGALLLTWDGYEIEDDRVRVWMTLLNIFAGTLVFTVLLSIYLSGLISQPLKKLSKAAENVRKGHGGAADIPDFSYRLDEIGDLSLVLRDMTGALSERMDSIERFAADVAHELKNPLTSLRSAVETLGVVKKVADKKKLMGIIEHDINRLDRLITDISRSSRLDTELLRESFEKIDLQSLLQDVLRAYSPDPLVRDDVHNSWRYSGTYNGVELKMDCLSADKVFVWGLPGHLRQVFENVLSNALSFADGYCSIFVKIEERRVFISIENDGPAIPENKLETIFERFYSERPEHEAYGQNSGLGLSICRQIIGAHDGRIFVENVSGRKDGCSAVKFTVVLNRAV